MSKRGNSEGSIFQRGKDKRWVGVLTLPGGKRKALYGRTQAEALNKLRAAQKTVHEGLPLGDERLTVGRWLDRWLEDIVIPGTRPRTAHRYAEIVRFHLKPRLGHLRLKALTPTDVQRMMRDGLDAGQSPRSVHHHRAVLRTALNAAVHDGLVSRNCAALAHPPHVPTEEQDGLTPVRAQAILEAVRGDRLESLYLLLLATGLRSGEALGLKWPAVDLQGGAVRVDWTLHRIDGEWRFLEPKTKRSRRTVPLPGPVVQSLQAHHVRQLEARLWLGPKWEGSKWGDLVFTNETGAPLGGDTALHHFQMLLVRSGLPKMRIQDLRHGAASIMAALGVPPRVAMELLGHSSITTTLNIYTHTTPEWHREAMELVSQGLWADVK